MTILEEARHTLIIIEHDPLLYEHVTEMTEYSLIKFLAGSSETGFGSTHTPGAQTVKEILGEIYQARLG
jgi:hypothetical protein